MVWVLAPRNNGRSEGHPGIRFTAQGLFTQTEGGDQPFTVAITGGTGAYRTAHGQVRVVQVGETERHYTLSLIS